MVLRHPARGQEKYDAKMRLLGSQFSDRSVLQGTWGIWASTGGQLVNTAGWGLVAYWLTLPVWWLIVRIVRLWQSDFRGKPSAGR